MTLTAKAEPEKRVPQMEGHPPSGVGVTPLLLAGTFRRTRMGQILEPEATGVKNKERLELRCPLGNRELWK